MSQRDDVGRRRFLQTGLGAAAGIAMGAGLPQPMSAAEGPVLPPPDEIFGWVEDLCRFGMNDRYGYRMPGTKSDRQSAEYILDKFQRFGLTSTSMEPVPVAAAFPDAWKLTVRSGGKAEEIPAYFLRYAKFTDAVGVSAPMVYVGSGTEADYARASVAGKIAVADIVSDGMRVPILNRSHNFTWPNSFFTYDPKGTLADDKNNENWPHNLGPAYQGAVKNGAAGFVGILELMAGDMNQYLHWYARYELPAVSISPRAGARLRETLRSGAADATIVLTGFKGQAETYNIYGFVPGKNEDEIITIMSHHDGWATNEASGTSIVLGLAKYFGQLPPKTLNRTLMFFEVGSHFGLEADWDGQGLGGVPKERVPEVFNVRWDKYEALAYRLLPKTVCANNVEMIGRQYKRKGDDFVPTGQIAPRWWGVTGPSADEANPALLSFMREAIQTHGLERSTVWPQFIGEASRYANRGVPTVHHISVNAWQFTKNDTPATVMKEGLQPTIAAFADIVRKEDAADVAALKPVATSTTR